MAHLIYRLLGVVVLWTSCIRCQVTLYQASSDVWGLASVTLQEVGVANGVTTFLNPIGGGVVETIVVSASGFTEDTINTILGLEILGGCQFVAANSVTCVFGNPLTSNVIVGTPLPFEIAVETMLVTTQNPTTSSSSSITPQTTGTSPSSTPTPTSVTSTNSATGSSFTGTSKPSSSTNIPSFLTAIPTPTQSSSAVNTGSNSAPKKSKSLTAVIGGIVGGIILLLLIFLTCWLVRRRRAKQAYLKATRATIYSFNSPEYTDSSIPLSTTVSASATPRYPQITRPEMQERAMSSREQFRSSFEGLKGGSNSEVDSDREEVAALQEQMAEILERVRRVEARGVGRHDYPPNYEESQA